MSAEFGTLGGKSLSSTLVGAFSLVGWYLGKNVDRLWSLSSHLQSLSSTLVGAFSLVGWYLGKNVDRLWSLSSHLQSLSSHRLVCVW